MCWKPRPGRYGRESRVCIKGGRLIGPRKAPRKGYSSACLHVAPDGVRWIEGYRSATAVLRSLLSSAGFCSCRAHRVRLPWSRTYRMSPAPPQAARYPPSNPSPRFTRRGIFSAQRVAQDAVSIALFLISRILCCFENPPGLRRGARQAGLSALPCAGPGSGSPLRSTSRTALDT